MYGLFAGVEDATTCGRGRDSLSTLNARTSYLTAAHTNPMPSEIAAFHVVPLHAPPFITGRGASLLGCHVYSVSRLSSVQIFLFLNVLFNQGSCLSAFGVNKNLVCNIKVVEIHPN